MLTLKENTMLGDIPGDWDSRPLVTLLREHYPGDWGEDRGPHMAKVLRSTNLTNDGRLDLEHIALRALPQRKADLLALKKDDLLLERSGGGPGQPVGRVGFVEADMPGYAFSNFLHLLRPDPEAINPRFLGWILYRINQTGRIIRLEQQTTQMRNLHFRDYLTMSLPVPPPDEQATIARILDAVDTALERTRNAAERARELRKSLIHELLVSGLRNERQRTCAAGLIPASWTCESLGEHIQEGPTNGVYRPEADYAAHGTRIVRIDDFEDGRINDVAGLRRVVVEPVVQVRYALREGDVLVNRVNSLSHIGKAALVPRIAEPTIFESNMMRLRCGPGLRPDFLAIVLCSHIARRHWLARAKPAVNQASINQRDVRELALPIPEKEEQREIADIVVAAQTQIELLVRVETGQLQLKKSLMRDLLTGRVRVSNEIKAAAS